MTSITPTIGRVLWFYPGTGFRGATAGDQPLPALVCNVKGDTCVNLGGFDAEGQHFVAQDVYLVPSEGGELPPAGEAHATWLPYQVATAAQASTGNNVAAGAQAPR